MGLLTKAFGHGTTAMGINTNARPYASVVLGRYNDTTATSPFAWTLTDPLFIIGNGVSNASRSNALTVLKNGNIGIGIPNPGFLLNFPSTLGDKISLWGSTGAHYGFGIQSNALQIHTDVSASDVVFGYGTSTALTETMRIKGNGNVGIATSTPDFKLDINGRMRIRHGADGSPGIWFNKSDNTSATSFMGVFNDEYVGIYGSQGSAWNFLMSTITGNVGIGLQSPTQKLHVNGGGLFSGSLFAIGSLGIGTTTPITKLHVNDGNSGATPPATSIATFENNGETTINLSAPDANYSGIRFNHPNRTGGIYYNKDDNDFGLTFATGSYPNMVITAPGYVGINNPSPDEMLDVWANGKFGGAVFASCGVLSCSDMRYKRDISPLTNALSHIQRLNGVYYYWDIEKHPDKRFSDQRQIGIIAQELEKVYPELVHTDNDGYKTVDYSRLSPILLEAIKEQQQIIELQNRKLENQQSQIDFLMKELHELKKKTNTVVSGG